MFKARKAPPISDKAEIDARYRYWRRHILITICSAMAALLYPQKLQRRRTDPRQRRMARTDIGLLATLFYITYGLSKFFPPIS
jgi:OPA family sugar phosphate sensor protein UhpC-like MFS transporter